MIISTSNATLQVPSLRPWVIWNKFIKKEKIPTNGVTLKDGGNNLSDTEMIANTSNNFFMNLGNTLKIDQDKQLLVGTSNVLNPVLKASEKYNTFFSILDINKDE